MGKKNRRKLRVAFRKNRQKRARRQNLTRELLGNLDVAEDELTEERISGKGEVTRHRTIVATTGSDDVVRRGGDESNCLRGRVLSFTGLNCLVQADDDRKYECTVRRVVRTMSRDYRSAVVTGDRVLFRPTGNENQGVVERIEPRSTVLSRRSQGLEHILVANVDQALIVTSADEPPLKPALIDRFLISSEKGGVPSIICINKVDLVDPVELQPLAGVYAILGYTVILTSTVDHTGIDRLRRLLSGHETVLGGQSGVGKSSLLNSVQPGLGLATSEVSDWTGKGRHTTRCATLLPLDGGGWAADTPGLRQFGLWDVIREEVEGFFIEFRPHVARCRFPSCGHTHEHGCGVKSAVERGFISPLRYASYKRIVEGDSL